MTFTIPKYMYQSDLSSLPVAVGAHAAGSEVGCSTILVSVEVTVCVLVAVDILVSTEVTGRGEDGETGCQTVIQHHNTHENVRMNFRSTTMFQVDTHISTSNMY